MCETFVHGLITLCLQVAVEPALVQQLLIAEVDRHEAQKESLFVNHHKQFPNWALELSEGANICLYGWGSKRDVLISFAETILIPQGVQHLR